MKNRIIFDKYIIKIRVIIILSILILNLYPIEINAIPKIKKNISFKDSFDTKLELLGRQSRETIIKENKKLRNSLVNQDNNNYSSIIDDNPTYYRKLTYNIEEKSSLNENEDDKDR